MNTESKRTTDRGFDVFLACLAVVGTLCAGYVGALGGLATEDNRFENEARAAAVERRVEGYTSYMQSINAFVSESRRSTFSSQPIVTVQEARLLEQLDEIDRRYSVVQVVGSDQAVEEGLYLRTSAAVLSYRLTVDRSDPKKLKEVEDLHIQVSERFSELAREEMRNLGGLKEGPQILLPPFRETRN